MRTGQPGCRGNSPAGFCLASIPKLPEQEEKGNEKGFCNGTKTYSEDRYNEIGDLFLLLGNYGHRPKLRATCAKYPILQVQKAASSRSPPPLYRVSKGHQSKRNSPATMQLLSPWKGPELRAALGTPVPGRLLPLHAPDRRDECFPSRPPGRKEGQGRFQTNRL